MLPERPLGIEEHPTLSPVKVHSQLLRHANVQLQVVQKFSLMRNG